MKILIILLFMLNINATYANENILFMTIPSNATADDAIGSIKAAAIKREWTAHEIENNKLRIELEHRRYKAVLDFSFTENKIHYSDLTTYHNRGANMWESKSVPADWLKNIKLDASSFLALNRRCTPVKVSFSHEDMEEKLESLKVLYNKKLITKTEYTLKKKELMSKY